jgi:hypothetical protein
MIIAVYILSHNIPLKLSIKLTNNLMRFLQLVHVLICLFCDVMHA